MRSILFVWAGRCGGWRCVLSKDSREMPRRRFIRNGSLTLVPFASGGGATRARLANYAHSAHFISKLITAARSPQLRSSSHTFQDYQDLEASAYKINWLSILLTWVVFQIKSCKVWNSYATGLTFLELTLYAFGRLPIIVNAIVGNNIWNLLLWWEDFVYTCLQLGTQCVEKKALMPLIDEIKSQRANKMIIRVRKLYAFRSSTAMLKVHSCCVIKSGFHAKSLEAADSFTCLLFINEICA